MWRIPNKNTALNDIQSILFQEYLDVLVAGISQINFVRTDCKVSAQIVPNMTVAIAAGEVVSNQILKTITAANINISMADTTHPRLDFIVIDSSGAKVVRIGTPASSPTPPALTANDVVLAVVFVPANATEIANGNITDLRVIMNVTKKPKFELFTENGTWVKDGDAAYVDVFLIGGGGGGGAGRKGAVGTVRCGGGGGGGGGAISHQFSAAILPNSVEVTIGLGGAGGIAQTTNSTNGANGNVGNPTAFGGYLVANGGTFGNGGSSTGGAGGWGIAYIKDSFSITPGNAGGNASTSGGTPTAITMLPVTPVGTAGGAGGGVTATNIASPGGTGQAITNTTSGFGTLSGGLGGNASEPGGNGNKDIYVDKGGTGGGGGGGSITTNGGTGGNGALYGAGGGGGGAATDSIGNSGAGGGGGKGMAVIITYY